MKVSLSAMAGDAYLKAATPLINDGLVDALVWSPETAWGPKGISAGTSQMLRAFEERGCLYGHGVQYSFLSAPPIPHYHEKWLSRLILEVGARKFTHFSEHFGYFATREFKFGAPLPVPFTHAILKLGRERLKRLKDIVGVPVGLENLALVYSREEALNQGHFVDSLLEERDGFIVLDLHNLYCQVLNFNLSWTDLLKSWPLHRVREIHISGGSYSEFEGIQLRRDTHDDLVPNEIWAELPKVLKLCVNCEVVTFERLPSSLETDSHIQEFHSDFLKLRTIVKGGRK